MGGQPRRSRDEPTAARGERAAGARDDASSRVVIEDVSPQVDGGRFAAKRAVGEAVDVEATIFADGHDLLAARLRHRRRGDTRRGSDVPMDGAGQRPLDGAVSSSTTLGRHEFTVEAWIDRFAHLAPRPRHARSRPART